MKKIIGLKPTTIIDIIAALFILLFLYTALSKSFQINNTVAVLKKAPIFNNIAEVTAWSIVIAEYIVAILLFLPRTKKIGLYSSLIIMTGFTIYIGYMMAFVPNLPCSCGGVISKMTWNQHLIFNLFSIILAFAGIFLGRRLANNKFEEIEPAPIVFT